MSTADAVRNEQTLPRQNGELVFAEPWEARAFAVAVALTESGRWEWDAFRARLVEEIDAWTARATDDPSGDDASWSYYERWAAALEAILRDQGLVEAAELDAAQARIASAQAHEHDHDHGA